MRDTSCPVCDSSSFQSSSFGLLRCEACGLFVNPRLWEPQANEAMEEEWFGEAYAIPKISAWVEWFERRNNRRTFERIQKAGVKPGRMLEIGIGSGSWLAFMKQGGWQVLGCDLSKVVCGAAEQRWSVSTHWGDVATLPHDFAYDLVVMNHVLEHVQRPIDMLKEVRERMSRLGVLHLAVPNVDCCEARFSGHRR